jgi:hypothetical protein
MMARNKIVIPDDLVLEDFFHNKNVDKNDINECIRISKNLGWGFDEESSQYLFFSKKSNFWFGHFKWILWMLMIGLGGIYGIISVLIFWLFWEGLQLNSKSMIVDKFTFDIKRRD